MVERRLLALTLGLYLLFGTGYSLLMPVWEAPDERAHYGYALRLARTGEGPSIEENYEAFQPPLYYLIASLPLRLIDAVRPDWVRPVTPGTLPPVEGIPRYDWNAENFVLLPGPLVVRWLGLVCGGITLLCVYGAVRRIFPDEPGLALGTVALMGGIPQFIHITASVNNDVLGILAGGLLFMGLADICRRESFSLSWIWIAAAALLTPIVTKLTVLPLTLTVLAAVLWQTVRLRPERAVRNILAAAGLCVVVILVLWVAVPEVVEGFIREIAYRMLSFRPGISEDVITNVVGRYLRNFWGKVGWLSVGIPVPAVAVLSAFAATGFGFALRALFFSGGRVNMTPAQKRLLVFSSIAVGAAGLMIFRNYLTALQLQGRFLFPTLAPIGLLIVFGWRSLLGSRARFLVPLLLALFALLNLHLWITGVIPVYFQPFLDG